MVVRYSRSGTLLFDVYTDGKLLSATPDGDPGPAQNISAVTCLDAPDGS